MSWTDSNSFKIIFSLGMWKVACVKIKKLQWMSQHWFSFFDHSCLTERTVWRSCVTAVNVLEDGYLLGVVPYSLIDIDRRFRRTYCGYCYCLHCQGDSSLCNFPTLLLLPYVQTFSLSLYSWANTVYINYNCIHSVKTIEVDIFNACRRQLLSWQCV
jgi:hypothetical protein